MNHHFALHHFALESSLRCDCSAKRTIKFKSAVIRSKRSSCYGLIMSPFGLRNVRTLAIGTLATDLY